MYGILSELIKSYDKIVIHRHKNPDGDAIGAQSGLGFLIRENFPGKKLMLAGDPAGRYSFIAGSTPDDIPDEFFNGALAILLDSSSSELIADERWKTAAKSIRIDHHIQNGSFCDAEICDNSYESCCGMIADFAREQKLSMSPVCAKTIYTGLVTDTGRFRYDCVNSRTFALASFLLQTGFTTADIFSNLYSDDLKNITLRAEFILKIRLTEKHVAWIYTTRDEIKEKKLDTFSVSRGMVSTMSDLRGIDIWVNFTEADEGVWCEIRSSKYNINPVAVKYGGGGHQKASGATLKDRDEAMKLLADLDAIIG